MLRIEHLRFVYPNGYEALKDVSLTIQDGEVAGIIGRSGAGKSTLLRCINGLERGATGTLEIDGKDVIAASGDDLRAIQRLVGFIWQEYNLVERLSVMNNVLSGRLGHRGSFGSLLYHFPAEDREIAVRSLERVSMLHRATHRADRLSGGEKQRVSIARALTQQPRVILADEPVASLDPELSEQVLADLARIARDEGVPTLINIHDVDLAVQCCDRICAIAQGVVVYDGPPSGLTDEVLNRTYRFDREWKSFSRGVVPPLAPIEPAGPGIEEAERVLAHPLMAAATERAAQISTEARLDLLRVWPRFSLRRVLLVIGVVLLFMWGLEATNARPAELLEGIPNMKNFVVRMFPPAFDTEPETLQTPEFRLGFATIPRIGFANVTFPFPEIIYSVVQTIQITIVGSAFAIVLSVPFALLAARNIAPHPLVYQTTRMLLNANRAIPDIIFALVFVAAVGLGPFGGVMALAVGSIGFMGKVFAEAIEAIDPEQVKAVRATGANRWQVISYAVVPQALPLVLSYALLLFESNVRSATILGLVGAGGVGFTLSKYMSLFQYDKLLGALIFIVLMVTLVDRFSDSVRRRFI